MNHNILKKKGRAEGFVLMVVLALLVFFSTIIQQAMVGFIGQSRILLAKKNRCYARELAYSFIPVALVSLFKPIEQKDKDSKQDQKKMSEISQFYLNYLTLANQTQELFLTKAVDGVDAKIEFRVVCEEGKINFNDIYDFKKNDIKEYYQPILSCFMLEQGKEKVPLVQVLKEYFKKNIKNYPVIDVFSIKLKENLPIMGKLDQLGKKLFLSDLFTIHTPEKSLNPILFSKTIQDGLGIEQKIISEPMLEKDRAATRKRLHEFCLKIDATIAQDWKKGLKTLDGNLWKSGSSAFLKDDKNIETLVCNLLSNEIEPKLLNVLIRVSFKSVEFSISAIVLREDSLADLFKANDFSKKKKDKREEGSAAKTVIGRQNLYTIAGLKILRVYENFQ